MPKIQTRELAIQLTIDVTDLCDKVHGRKIYTDQVMRSASSIGANISEAKYAQSSADLVNKLEIALKECSETEYWLETLYKIKSIDKTDYDKLVHDCGVIRRTLISSITTTKQRYNL